MELQSSVCRRKQNLNAFVVIRNAMKLVLRIVLLMPRKFGRLGGSFKVYDGSICLQQDNSKSENVAAI